MRALSFAAFASLALLASPGFALADGLQTDLVLSGTEALEITASDVNACYLDSQNALNVQLADPNSAQIISIYVLATLGDHPAKAADGHPQLTMAGLDTTQDDPFINWSATGGTVTLDNIDTQVALDDGSASTHGAMGHIDADLSSTQGTLHISGPFACHLAG
jgi:hypothetical protein